MAVVTLGRFPGKASEKASRMSASFSAPKSWGSSLATALGNELKYWAGLSAPAAMLARSLRSPATGPVTDDNPDMRVLGVPRPPTRLPGNCMSGPAPNPPADFGSASVN